MATDGNSLGQGLLKEYGNCLSVYHGNGILTLEDGKKLDCAFEAGQLNNGRVLLLCDFLPPFPTCLSISAAKFEGTTSEGFRICANRGLIEVNYLPDIPVDSSVGVWAAFRLDEMSVQIAEDEHTQRLHFGITNFEFIGTEPTRRSDNSSFLTLPLDLRSEGRSTKFSIRPVDLYDKIIKCIKTLKSIDVSCEVIADIPTDGNIAFITEVVEDLCYILSVARGTKVQWVYRDQYDVTGKLMSRTHSSRITKPYCPLNIICPIDSAGRETKTFVEQAYKVYVEKRESFKLSKGTIDAYLDAKAEADYLEIRSAKLALAMEMLKSVLLEMPDETMKGYIIKEKDFRKLIDPLCNAIDKVLCVGGIDENSRKEIYENIHDKGKILELNRKSFASLLKWLCNDINLETTGKEIRIFVESRNKLVHNGRFYCELATSDERKKLSPLPSKIHEYLFLVNFLDRVFLKLLGYGGPYIDWRVPGSPTRQEQV